MLLFPTADEKPSPRDMPECYGIDQIDLNLQ